VAEGKGINVCRLTGSNLRNPTPFFGRKKMPTAGGAVKTFLKERKVGGGKKDL